MVNMIIIQAFPFLDALVQPGLTCVTHSACYLAFLFPVLGNNGICEFQESLQWAFMLTARDCQWERFLPALIPEEHLHREVTENKTQLDVVCGLFCFVFFSPAEVIPSQKLNVHTLSFILVVVFLRVCH